MNLRGMGGVESGEGWVDMMKIHCMNVFSKRKILPKTCLLFTL